MPASLVSLQESPCISSTQQDFAPLVEVKRRFATAFQPSPWIFWSDFLVSAGLGWTAFFGALHIPFPSPLYLFMTSLAIIALLRAAIFIHEIAHLKRGSLPGFEIAWNIGIGIPFLLPSLMYDSHSDHHRQTTFGTLADPEYAPIAYWSQLRLGAFVVGTLFVPWCLILRWGVVGPLSFFIPSLRRFVIERGSSLTINPAYRCARPRARKARRWLLQEITVTAGFWLAALLAYMGVIPLFWLIQWYIVGAGMLLVNQVRTLAAHRYTNEGQQFTALEQLLDSINLTGWPLPTVFAAPVGLRYHALHHFLPTVPYHSLGLLHRRLTAELPADSPYRCTEEHGIFSAIYTLLRRSATDPSLRNS